MAVAFAALSISCTWQERMEEGLALGINQIRSESGLAPLDQRPATDGDSPDAGAGHGK